MERPEKTKQSVNHKRRWTTWNADRKYSVRRTTISGPFLPQGAGAGARESREKRPWDESDERGGGWGAPVIRAGRKEEGCPGGIF